MSVLVCAALGPRLAGCLEPALGSPGRPMMHRHHQRLPSICPAHCCLPRNSQSPADHHVCNWQVKTFAARYKGKKWLVCCSHGCRPCHGAPAMQLPTMHWEELPAFPCGSTAMAPAVLWLSLGSLGLPLWDSCRPTCNRTSFVGCFSQQLYELHVCQTKQQASPVLDIDFTQHWRGSSPITAHVPHSQKQDNRGGPGKVYGI